MSPNYYRLKIYEQYRLKMIDDYLRDQFQNHKTLKQKVCQSGQKKSDKNVIINRD